jgi:hypothetical protein
MQRKRVNLKKRIVVQATLAACTAVTGWIFWTTWHQTLLARYWENELTATAGKDGRGADEVIGRLLKLGRPGLAAVVRALGHERVDRAAWRALDRLVTAYENGPPEEAMARLETVAVALADDVDGLPVASRPRAAKLAMRIVVCLQRSSAVDSGPIPAFDAQRVTAACDRVLRACDSSPDDVLLTEESPDTPATTEAAEAPQKEHANEIVHARTVLPADHSMYLELAELAPPDLPRAAATNVVQPRLLLSTEAKPLATNDAAGASRATSVSDDRAADGGQSDPAIDAARRLREVDSLDLFARLNEPTDAQAAAAELASRGFSPRQVDVGRHLVSRDPAERLRWAEVLPGIRGVDARFWLLRLSHDTNVQVRRSAVGLLATDRDPEVIRRLRQIAVEETDPDLRNQAGRALDILDGEPEGAP